MRRVLFFVLDGWAFGSLHNGLCKELYKHGIHGQVINWTIPPTNDEWSLYREGYDVIVTTADAFNYLHEVIGIPLEKIIGVAHGRRDILTCVSDVGDNTQCTPFDPSRFGQLNNYAVVCDWLVDVSIKSGIKTIPKRVKLGVNFNTYYSPIREKLEIVGYASDDKKNRHSLVEEAVRNTGTLKFFMNAKYHYAAMPGFYKLCSSVVTPTVEETVGLPNMEAAAAGCLVMSTPVGYFKEHGPKGGGITLPDPSWEINTPKIINTITEQLNLYKDPVLYKQKCEEIQQYARDNYDWSKNIDGWLDLLS